MIPFVGAGLSAGLTLPREPTRFPPWRKLLSDLASGLQISPRVETLLADSDFEAAASIIDQDRPGVLGRRIRDAFDRDVPQEQLLSGALSYLPLLTSGPVITTNYDSVLEQAFSAAERPLAPIIAGPQFNRTVAAVHGNQQALLKIHGDCKDDMFRVLTVEEYERAYGVATTGAAPAGNIGSLAWLLFTNRPLLFIGCSLSTDRTVQVLREIQARLPGLTHYAVLSAEPSAVEWEAREKQLDTIGVRPLWYRPKHHEEIEPLLHQVVEGAATSQVVAAHTLPPPARPLVPPQVDFAAVTTLFRPGLATADRHASDLRLITRAILEGRLAFFLGAYACLDPTLTGATFYDDLAKQFDCPKLAGDRTAVAAYITNRYGYPRLLAEIRSQFETYSGGPSVIHRLIAALPGFLRARGRNAPLWILTTNYDTFMEQALEAMGEPFHLLYYVNEPGGGLDCFFEQTPDGAVRRIDRPGNLRRIGSAAHVLVKLNGGLSYYRDIPERVAVERAQFERLAAGIPAILPAFLRSGLRARSLLFMGHGLWEPDVNALIRYASGGDSTMKSWAVQLRTGDADALRAWDEKAADLSRQGLRLVDADLETFAAALYRHLQTSP